MMRLKAAIIVGIELFTTAPIFVIHRNDWHFLIRFIIGWPPFVHK